MTETLLCDWVKNSIIGMDLLGTPTLLNNGMSFDNGISMVFSGGVAQNIKACKAISELEEVKEIEVLPAAGDASLSIGACYFAGKKYEKHLTPLDNIYLGPTISDKEIEYGLLNNFTDLKVCEEKTTPKRIAALLANGNVIARCSGRIEFGHRALGNRSIIADSRDVSIVKRINDKIKYRDFWMPFTGSILSEDAHKYFHNPKNLKSDYMTMAFDSTDRAKNEIPATLHPADFTCRPQTIKREQNKDYYDIISEFKKLTNVGGILNTSLNLHGEPIVCNANDALNTFVESDLDYLLLNNILIGKEN